jgi:Flp pilus assembly protein CpaB
MTKLPDQNRKSESEGISKSRAGAKEVLTRDLARKIVRMIEQFPDADIAVTWDDVMQQTKLRFGRQFQRNVLSQKTWDGRRLIAEAFQGAKEVQRRQARDTVPKYANEPRSRLRLIVAKRQSEILALREQLDRVRGEQYDEIHSLLDTRMPLNRPVELRSKGMSKGRVGAKEVLTLALASKIVRMIEHFPDANIAVTWDNVMRQTKLRFGHRLQRNVLSQKTWDGRRLIAEAFQDAKEIQRRQARDTAPKYADEPRARLRMILVNLQSEILALREQLARVRAMQYDEILSLLDTRTPLNRLVELRSELSSTHANEPERNASRETVRLIEEAMPGHRRKRTVTASDSPTPGKGS